MNAIDYYQNVFFISPEPKALLGEEDSSFFSNEEPINSQKVDNGFSFS